MKSIAVFLCFLLMLLPAAFAAAEPADGQELVLTNGFDLSGLEYDSVDSPVRIVLEKDYTGALPTNLLTVREWVVREGNPVYSSRGGVLFSADGRILYNYPCELPALHYDVPAGTEVIAVGAFGTDGIPLRTLSLPIGLRRIEDYAFSGCGRLISLTVPLTVTSLAKNAFYDCVSLERLSLPPGLTAAGWEHDNGLHEDLSRYMGDNGPTLASPRRTDATGGLQETRIIWRSVRLSGENGEEPVPVYGSAESETPVKTVKSGKSVQFTTVSGRRAKIWDYGNDSWVDLACTVPDGQDVFFLLWDAVAKPTEEGTETLRLSGMTADDFAWMEDDLSGCFYRLLPDGTEEEMYLPPEQLIVYRPRTGDSRTLALLQSDREESPLRLLDAPDGGQTALAYHLDQAEILETEGAWARIRTISGNGWVPVSCLRIVDQLPEE